MSEVKSLMDFVKAAKSKIEEIPVSELESLIAQGYNILDVREHDEYLQGTLPNAFNLPRGMLEACCDENYPAKKEEMMDRNKPWLVLCATSGRSAMATDVMQQMGFTNVKNINGGMAAIRDAAIDIVRPPLHQK